GSPTRRITSCLAWESPRGEEAATRSVSARAAPRVVRLLDPGGLPEGSAEPARPSPPGLRRRGVVSRRSLPAIPLLPPGSGSGAAGVEGQVVPAFSAPDAGPAAVERREPAHRRRRPVTPQTSAGAARVATEATCRLCAGDVGRGAETVRPLADASGRNGRGEGHPGCSAGHERPDPQRGRADDVRQ